MNMNWLKKVMAGRYGSNQLSLSLLALSAMVFLLPAISMTTAVL